MGWFIRQKLFAVCGDLGKASVRWAALMCRNAEIPLWLCGSAVSLRQLPPPPPSSPNPQQDHGNEPNRRHLESTLSLSLSLSHVHTHNYSLTTLYSGVSVYYKDSVREIKWRGRIRFSYGIFIRPFPVISPPTSTSFKLGAPALIVANFYFKGWKQKKL